jgi:choline dehydrogenase-like flavoprotein
VSHEPRIQQLHEDFQRTGPNPFHLPAGVDMNEEDPEQGKCLRCAKFDGFPCLTDGKADAHVCAIRPALQHQNVTLLRHAYVTDASGGTVTEVVVNRNGAPESYSADIVVSSCGALSSAHSQ